MSQLEDIGETPKKARALPIEARAEQNPSCQHARVRAYIPPGQDGRAEGQIASLEHVLVVVVYR